MQRKLAKGLAARVLTLAIGASSLALAPAAFDFTAAYAKGGGGGNGGGNGGGHGGGNSGGHGAVADAGDRGLGRDKAEVADSSRGSAKAIGAKETADARARSKALTDAARTYASASELGPLNAAHASLTAFEHAAPNSTVGRIASYDAARQDALSLVDPVDRRRALRLAERRLALDFDRTLTRAEINAVNAILDDKR